MDICPFEEAERSLRSFLPDGIKKFFIANGFSNQFILSKLDENDILLTEQFARDILPDLIDTIEYPKYYGIFKNNIHKFQILTGYKKLLLCISEFYKEKYSNKPVVHLLASTDNTKASANMPITKKPRLEILNVDLPAERTLVQK